MIDPNSTGVFEGLSFEEYQKLSGVSNSMLNKLNESPEDYRFYLSNQEDSGDDAEEDVEQEETSKGAKKSMGFGTLVHTAILEPDEVEKRYVVAPTHYAGEKLNRTKKLHKEFWNDFVAKNPDRTVVKGADWEACLWIRDRIAKHSTIPALLAGALKEVSFQAQINDRLLRGRCDALNRNIGAIVDVKTSKKIKFHSFQNSIFYEGYHRQGAMYTDILAALEEKLEYYFIIGIENIKPYKIALFQLPPEVIELGRKELQKLLETLAECERTGEWKGYPEEPQIVGVPSWKLNQLGDEYFE